MPRSRPLLAVALLEVAADTQGPAATAAEPQGCAHQLLMGTGTKFYTNSKPNVPGLTSVMLSCCNQLIKLSESNPIWVQEKEKDRIL